MLFQVRLMPLMALYCTHETISFLFYSLHNLTIFIITVLNWHVLLQVTWSQNVPFKFGSLSLHPYVCHLHFDVYAGRIDAHIPRRSRRSKNWGQLF